MKLLSIVLILFSSISFIIYGLSLLFSTKMKNEFIRFGLEKFQNLVGILQLLGGVGLSVGLFLKPILLLSSGGIAMLMLVGFGVRLKVKDGFWLSMPALLLFLLNLYIFAIAFRFEI